MEKTIIFLMLLVATLLLVYFLALSQYAAEPLLGYSSKVKRKAVSKILGLGGAIYLVVLIGLCWLLPVAWYLIVSQAAAWIVFFMALAFFAVKLWIAAWPALIASISLFAYFVIEIFWVAIVGWLFFLLVAAVVLLIKRS